MPRAFGPVAHFKFRKGDKMEEKTIDATQLLMDQDIEKILIGTYQGARSALELSEIYGIPTATCFRKIRQLREMGLLEIEKTVYTSNDKKVDYYSANLENAYVYYDSGRLKVRFKVVLQMANDFRRRYEQFADKPSIGRT